MVFRDHARVGLLWLGVRIPDPKPVDQRSARRASPAVLQLLILGFRPPPAQEAGQVRCPDGRTHQMGGFPVKIVLQHRGGAAE